MKKILLLAAVLCIVFSSVAMAAMPDTIRIGDSRDIVEQLMVMEGISPYIDGDNTLAYETEDMNAYFSLDETGKVDFICYTYYLGGTSTMDFTVPDWNLTWDGVLASLKNEGASHEAYWNAEYRYPTIYVNGIIFDTMADLALEFDDNGMLDKVSVYGYEEPVMNWAMRAAHVLGVPDIVNRRTKQEGICTDVIEDTEWVMEDGSYYTLTSNVSFAAFVNGVDVDTVADTQIELCVYAPAR